MPTSFSTKVMMMSAPVEPPASPTVRSEDRCTPERFGQTGRGRDGGVGAARPPSSPGALPPKSM